MAQVTHVRTQRVTTAILKNLYKQANIAGNPPPYFQITDDVLLTDSTAGLGDTTLSKETGGIGRAVRLEVVNVE